MFMSLTDWQFLQQHSQELAAKFTYLGITASDLMRMGFDELMGNYNFLTHHGTENKV